MTDWAKFIERYNLWHNLCGLKSPDHERCKGVLKLFWERYKNIDGSHGVFHAGIPLCSMGMKVGPCAKLRCWW